MTVVQVKYVLWAEDMDRAIRFYCDLFGGELRFQTEVWSEVTVAGAIIGLHEGGEGKRTWTGLSFQTTDVVAAAKELVAAGGILLKDPEDVDADEEPHLAMCVDTEGNEIMLTQKRTK
ncbi:MAG: VOC family protein [Verrucomicrobiota bacterium]